MVHDPGDEEKGDAADLAEENLELADEKQSLLRQLAALEAELAAESEVRRRTEVDLHKERTRAEMLQTERDREWAPRHVPAGDYRKRDRVGRLAPRNPFGDPVVLFHAVGGLAGKFLRVVPRAQTPESVGVHGKDVTCVCGTRTALASGHIIECGGKCGRWFLAERGTVRCAKLGTEE